MLILVCTEDVGVYCLYHDSLTTISDAVFFVDSQVIEKEVRLYYDLMQIQFTEIHLRVLTTTSFCVFFCFYHCYKYCSPRFIMRRSIVEQQQMYIFLFSSSSKYHI